MTCFLIFSLVFRITHLPVVIVFVLLLLLFPPECCVYMYTAAVCAAYQIASLIHMYYMYAIYGYVCLGLCVEKFSQFSFLIVSRFFFYTFIPRQENHFINCQLDEYIGIILSLHTFFFKKKTSFSQILRNLVTIVALILKLLHSIKRQNEENKNQLPNVCNQL